MEYQTFGRTTLFIGLLKNLFHQGGVTVWRNGVGKSFPGIQVNDDTNGINVLLHSSIRDVAHPNFIGGVRIKILLQSVPAILIVSVCGSSFIIIRDTPENQKIGKKSKCRSRERRF